MSDNPIINWLQRIFRLVKLNVVFTVVTTVLALVFAYFQLIREDGGTLLIVQNGKPTETPYTSPWICAVTTDGHLNLNHLDTLPTFANQTKYAVKNLLIKGTASVDKSVSVWIDEGWSYAVHGSDISLRYKDNVGYPHLSIASPVTYIKTTSAGGMQLSCTATFEGSEFPQEYTARVFVARLEPKPDESREAWEQRAFARAGECNISGSFIMGYGGQYYSSNLVKKNTKEAKTAPPVKTAPATKKAPAKTVAAKTDSVQKSANTARRNPAPPFIDKLEDVKFHFPEGYAPDSISATFKAPGRNVRVVPVFSYIYGPDSVELPWYKLFNKGYKRYSTVRLKYINADATALDTYGFKGLRRKFIGFAKEKPELAPQMRVSGDTIFNNSEKIVVAVITYYKPGEKNSWSYWLHISPGYYGILNIEEGADITDITYLEAPYGSFAKRHPVLRVVFYILLIGVIFLMVLPILIWIVPTRWEDGFWTIMAGIAALFGIIMLVGEIIMPWLMLLL